MRQSPGPFKILFVEDVPDDAELVAYRLRKGGFIFEYDRVQTRDAFTAALTETDLDIVLCDNRLPDFDAASAIQIEGRIRPDLPIVIVTGTLEDEAAVELVKAGASDYVRKDRLGRLPVAVAAALESARQRRMQRESDAALKASESRHRRQFETATDGIMLVNAETRRIYAVNQAIVSLLGYPRTEYLGKKSEDFGILGMDDLPIQTMRQTGDHYRCAVVRLCAKDGRPVDVEFIAVAYQAGQELVIQCNLRDITERARFEDALRQKNRELKAASVAKDQFLASMSHELRTPLNGIIGFAGILLMKLPGDLTSEQERQLKSIRSSAHHLLSLINDLLNLAKVQSGKMDLGCEAVDCRKILQEIATSLGPSAVAKGLEIRTIVPGYDVTVTTSQRALWQIVTNLAANAIKYTDEGQVSLELRSILTNGDRRTEILVRDTGIGIHEEDQSKLFVAFSRIERRGDGAIQRTEGTGLGLYISQELATLIGGDITVASEYRKGSTFTLALRDRG
jgi:PAS domain S-box-containing protein